MTTSSKSNIPQISSIDELFKYNLMIPDYQRPYKGAYSRH